MEELNETERLEEASEKQKASKSNVIKSICYNAIVCALYVALVYLFYFMSYEAVQFRIAEILIFLVLINKKYTIGITMGCFIANLLGPFGIIDAVVGGAATLLSCILIVLCKKAWLGVIFIPVSNILVGIEIALIDHLTFTPAVITTLWVMLGEVVVAALGLGIYYLIIKKEKFIGFIGDF